MVGETEQLHTSGVRHTVLYSEVYIYWQLVLAAD